MSHSPGQGADSHASRLFQKSLHTLSSSFSLTGSVTNDSISALTSASLEYLRSFFIALLLAASLYCARPNRSLIFSATDVPTDCFAFGHSVGSYRRKLGSTEVGSHRLPRSLLYFQQPWSGSPLSQVVSGKRASVTGCIPALRLVNCAFLPPEPSCCGGIPVHVPVSPFALVSAKHPHTPHHTIGPDLRIVCRFTWPVLWLLLFVSRVVSPHLLVMLLPQR